MSTNTTTKTDEPEIPEEILARKAIPLSPMAAEALGMKPPKTMTPAQARMAKARAARGKKKYEVLENPSKGLTAAQIEEIRGRTYKGMPKGDPMLGDMDPKIIEWFRQNPDAQIRKDGAIRYFGRIDF